MFVKYYFIYFQQKVHDLKYENGNIFVRYHTSLSLVAGGRKPSETTQPAVINFPPKRGKVTNEDLRKERKERKTSVLETPLRL